MSGGVDSAVSALLLLRQGYRVEGLFMKNWEEDDRDGHCAAEEDLLEAEKACQRLGIALHKVNFSHEYWERVFEHFLAEYRAGRTPNPDVLCNREIKFKAFLDHALGLGARRIATGHYARTTRAGGRVLMRTGADADKDQSYFLYALDQRALGLSLFPVGALDKARVRAIARQAGLPNHARRDSTGICFIGKRRFRAFLARYLPARPGEIVTLQGHTIGQHAGLMYHTLGQRQGLGIGGRRGAAEAPWYVAGKDLQANRLIVVQGHDHPALFRSQLVAAQAHWISGEAPSGALRCTARLRYRQAPQACRAVPLDETRWQVRFDAPQRAPTPGQSVVFYAGDVCLGGGIIEGHLLPGAP
jgi:tRNA-specific 2-thiouridylase